MVQTSSDTPADILIVGAGAAGLTAAIFAAEALGARAGNICVIDGARRPGAKILVSGGGRCNVTNRQVRPEDFHGHRVLVRNVLAAFSVERTVAWFDELGVELVEEEAGKLFPASGSARSVLDALLNRCSALGVVVEPNRRVTSVSPTDDDRGFLIDGDRGGRYGRRLILATGGRSLPRTGSDGTGWRIAEELGHSVTATVPALVPLVLADGFIHRDLSGMSCEVTLATRVEGKILDQRTGSLLWTHFGVSGPVVLDASRCYTIAKQTGRSVSVSCDFAKLRGANEVDRELLRRAGLAPRASAKKLLAGFVPERLAAALCGLAGVDADVRCGQLSKAARRALVAVLIDLELPVVSDRGWNHAEVTAGGVPLAEIDYRTMQSRRIPGLYLVGEMLDCDGRIGGFNFQWAWATGFVAGTAAAESLQGTKQRSPATRSSSS